ncbi:MULTISPECIES: hypothetical protein [Paenibacillus]|uniref:hypothetical protein n=1 Tax=Paenibacillus TaxID=44249 RepID=UPI0009EE93BA|nr:MULTISPECIES: hypothetical protein [Paenibacillus]GIP23643.1 hypothetical protein J22TS3_39180 [Paenibacillus sp. J22TS3]
MKRSLPHTKITIVLFLLLSLGALYSPSSAHAGYLDDFFSGVQEITEIPAEVNQLKQEYKKTVNKLEEAQGTVEAYRKQNEALMEQNKKLNQTVQALTEAEKDREASSKRIRILVITGAALLLGYFILLRVLRVVLRR